MFIMNKFLRIQMFVWEVYGILSLNPTRHSKIPSWFGCRFSRKRIILEFTLCWDFLCRSREIHAQMLTALLDSNISRTPYILSVTSKETLSTSLITFASTELAAEGWITCSSGQCSRTAIHSGPCHQTSRNSKSPPLFATSAGYLECEHVAM